MPTPGPRTTYRYSDAFKATAVRLSQLPGVSVRDVAESLYIHPFMLSRWRRLAREGQIMAKGVDVDPAVVAELKELRPVEKQWIRPWGVGEGQLEHVFCQVDRDRRSMHGVDSSRAPVD